MRFHFKNPFQKIIKTTLIVLSLFFLLFLISPLLILDYGKNHIYLDSAQIPSNQIAIVFGAGVKSDGTPSDMLKDRLLTVTELYNLGIIDKILVSGDNRFENYNEPDAMYRFLVDQGIPENLIYRDYAGLNTYSTCLRAKTLWGVDHAILISQGYHLPRAIFTCHALGIESTGYSATLQPYLNSTGFKSREVLGLYSAVFEVYIWARDTIGGNFEEDLDP
ncbi:MAG: ElyC/SanA/YdcF family protein [Candidatus Gracilibacteria bacterium]